MINELLTNPQVQAAIAVVLAVVIGALLKRKIDYNKLNPIISFIISLILKAEETGKPGEAKFELVQKELTKKLDNDSKETLVKKFGSLPNAVQWVFDKFGQSTITSVVKKLKR